MKNYNHEDELIKDALSGATPPDIADSWGKMEQMLDAAVAEEAPSGFLSRLFSRYKIWLNSFVLLMMSTMIAGMMYGWKPRAEDVPDQKTSSGHVVVQNQNDRTNTVANGIIWNRFSQINNVAENHASENRGSSARYTRYSTPDNTGARRYASAKSSNADEIKTSEILPGEPIIWSVEELEEKEYSDDEEFLVDGETEESGSPIDLLPTAHGNKIGLRLGINGGPGFSASHMLRYAQYGFYLNLGKNPVQSLQMEFLYNPVPVKAHIITQRSSLPAGQSRTDSISIQKLNYFSVPVMIRYEGHRNFNLHFGVQFSVLTGTTGDRYTTTSVSGEQKQVSSFRNLGGIYGLDRTNLGGVVGIGYTHDRISATARYQGNLSSLLSNRSLNYNVLNLSVSYNLK